MPRKHTFGTGPYGAVPTKEGGGVIGSCPCKSCNSPVVVKVNKSGWPYAFCTAADCKNQHKTQGRDSAAYLISLVETWHEPAKAMCLSIANISLKPPSTIPPVNQETQEDVVPEPEINSGFFLVSNNSNK